MSAIDELCPRCGLCCNGILFADVELRAKDDPEHLAALGLALHPKGRTKAFDQPCACLAGGLCRIYASRPVRCRTFECAALKRAQEGSLTIDDARRAISSARRHSEDVLQLVRKLGDVRETVPLSRRYTELMAQPMDLSSSDERSLELRGELMLAVGRLVQALERDFLAGPTRPQSRKPY